MTGKYEGIHAFLFLHDDDPTAPEEVIEAIQPYISDEGPVFFASMFEGTSFRGFVHFAADSLEALIDFKDHELFDAGVRSDYVTEGAVLGATDVSPMGPKRHSPRYCAICRVRTTQRPDEVLEAIARAFDRDEPLVGASRVIGRFPLLVELGSEDPGELEGAIERLRNVDGVNGDAVRVGTVDTGDDGSKSSGA